MIPSAKTGETNPNRVIIINTETISFFIIHPPKVANDPITRGITRKFLKLFRILKNDERGRQVFDYVDKITKAAKLNALYEWEEDEVVIRSE